MAEVTVRMPYIPNLTANHAYRRTSSGRVYLRPEARDWRALLAYRIKNSVGQFSGQNITVRADWYSPKEPDQDNRMKLVCDAVQMATGINDKHFIIEHGTWQHASGDAACIVVTVRWDGEKECGA